MNSRFNKSRYSDKEMGFFYTDLKHQYESLEDNHLVQIALQDCRPIRQRWTAYSELSRRVFVAGFSSYGEVCAFIGFAREVQAATNPEWDNVTGHITMDIIQAEDIAREFEREIAARPQFSSWSLLWKAG